MKFNRLLQVFSCWGTPQPEGDLSSAQIILTQAAPNLVGNREYSLTNVALALMAERLQRELDIPIFAQEEVAVILRERGADLVGSTPVFSNVPITSKQYGTGSEGVARLQLDFCQAHGYRSVIIIAFVPHAWRAIWTYQKLGFDVIVPPNLPQVEFQKEFEQWRWRSPITAYPYELLARLAYFKSGFI
jgi:hypothetical protein